MAIGSRQDRVEARDRLEAAVAERTADLRASEERYALVMEAAADGHMDWDLVRGKFYLSPRMLEIVGHPPDARFADRADWVRRFPFHPADRGRWEAAVAAHFAGREAKFKMDVRIVVNGETRWLAFKFISGRDAAGRVVRWTGSISDLEDANRDLATVLDAIPGPVAILTPAGEVDVANHELIEYCGQPTDALRHWGSNETVHADDLPGIANLFAQAMTTGDAYEFEARIRRFDGVYRWNQVRGLPSRDAGGRIVRWYVLLSDTDSRRRVEEALRESETRFRGLTAIWSDWYWEQDEQLRFSYSSAAVDPPAGYPGGDAVGKTRWELPGIVALSSSWADHQELLAAHRPFRDFEYSRPAADGTLRYVSTSGSPIFDESGQFRGYHGVARDISERKRAEEALRKSEQRHERAMLASQAGLWDWDLVTDDYYVSPRSIEMCGFPRDTPFAGREDFMGRAPFYPEDRAAWNKAVKELFAGDGSRVAMDVRMIVDGKTVWNRLDGMCFRDEAGRAIRSTGSATDVTERKLAEEALREQTERLKLGQAALRTIIMDWSIREDLLTWSDSPEWLLGPLPASGRYPLFKDQVHPEDRHNFLATRSRALATLQGQTTEFRIVRTDGKAIWVLERKHVFAGADGKAVRMLAAMFDITDRKHAEEALRESQERYALAVAGSDDGVWDIDFAAGRVFLSARARELAGMPPGPETVPLDEWSASLPVHPEDSPRRTAAMQDHLEGRTPAYAGEFRLRQPDGVYCWRRIHGLCLRDANGKPHRMAGSISDIDVRKRAEDALRLSEERYALALEASEEGHFDIDLQTNEIFVSARLNEIYGFSRQAETANRAEYLQRLPIHPDDRHLLDDIRSSDWEDAARVQRLERYSLRIVPRPGETRWIQILAMVKRDAHGRVNRRVGKITDITHRVLAEEALRLSEDRYARVMAAANGGFWDWDVAKDEFHVSPRLLEMSDMPLDSTFSGREDFMRRASFHPEDRERWQGAVRQLFASRDSRVAMDVRSMRRDGSFVWQRLVGMCFRDTDGKVVRWVGSTTDINDRKLAENALRESEMRYERVMIASKAGFWDWDAIRDEYYTSPRLIELIGFEPGTRFSGREDFLRRAPFHPEDREKYTQAVRDLFATGGSHLAVELRFEGGVRWAHLDGMCQYDAAGRLLRWTGFVTDITQRRQTEEELRKMEVDLRRAQRLEAIGTLAGGIAHDFNNILGAVLGYGEMAMRSAKKGSRLHRDLDSIMHAGERGRALVDRILAYSRSGVADRVPVHVEAVVREALHQIAASRPETVTIAPNLCARRAAMLGDSTQVHQVVMNLASNGVQAMPEGGVLRVGLETVRFDAPRTALVGSIAVGEYIVLTVNDSGTGIPEDVLERMFDPFFTTKEVGVGSGLGLSLVHGIVTSVGGAIDVATEIGKGSTFTAYLPRSGDATDDTADDSRPMPRGAGQRVLVLDDEAPLVRLATETLTHLGYAPVGFTSSVNALREFSAHPERFDAVLTDERMPAVTGSMIIREVRRIKPSIPILLMSGFVSGAAAVKARELGADDVLKKPLLARELAASLARALQL